MAEIALRRDPVAHQLLQSLDVRKAAVALAVPHNIAADFDGESAAGRWQQRYLAELLGERGEKLLRHPRRPQQPIALAAVGDRNARLGVVHARMSPRPVFSSSHAAGRGRHILTAAWRTS